jgi:hypothetical protein
MLPTAMTKTKARISARTKDNERRRVIGTKITVASLGNETNYSSRERYLDGD